MAFCRVSDIPGLTYREWLLGSWSLGAAVALLALAWPRPRRAGHAMRALGLGVMTIPVWQVLLDTAPDMARTFCVQGNVAAILPAAAPPQVLYGLSTQYIAALLMLSYIAVGGLLWCLGNDPTLLRQPTTRRIGAALRGLLPMGRGELASLRVGVAAFPLLAGANVALVWLTGLRTQYFRDVTAYHAVVLAVASGVLEELLYRGVLQQGLKRLLGWSPARPRIAATLTAIALQALPFAYAHASYGAPTLLLFAFLFAALAGIVTEAFGIWAAIALHVLIDFYGFALEPNAGVALVGLAWLVAAPVLWIAATQARRIVRRVAPA